ncbi:sensor histidine kinase [Neptunomonas sp. XY-337]|uniref:sensor histidine kinase n=1 Tax=Neptunomonas sp. XY-337 TaxID=2561897 RepID=UPI0010AA84C4|nr:sensor histidine kinase [Neptunomonas sp. XY-337]
MSAVLRLNLLVAGVFTAVLVITLYFMLGQAAKDIKREVVAGVSFTHQLLTLAGENEVLLKEVLEGDSRHVQLEMAESLAAFEQLDRAEPDDEEAPAWFINLIPGIEPIVDKAYYRYLPDGRVLRLKADPSDELGEVWESVQQVLFLFGLSVVLSNLAIYLGVRQGVRPVADFLAALHAIEKGQYTARLDRYGVSEVNSIAEHFNAMAEALEEAQSDNSRLTHELLRLQETERAHLARELHDDLGQYLAGIRAHAYLLQQRGDDKAVVQSVGEHVAQHCDAMQQSFRALIRKLHPVILEQLGLAEAIRTQVDRWQQTYSHLQVDMMVDEPLPLFDDETNTHIYRVVQEALNNVAQHAKATHVRVRLSAVDGQLSLLVEDNGNASPPSRNKTGLGLRSMSERARCMEGELQFEQRQGQGTRLSLTVPIREIEYEDIDC